MYHHLMHSSGTMQAGSGSAEIAYDAPPQRGLDAKMMIAILLGGLTSAAEAAPVEAIMSISAAEAAVKNERWRNLL